MNRRELQDLSKLRLKEAEALLDLGLCDGAFYLAGYAVECGLKACISKGTRRGDFPDKKRVEQSHTHNFQQLVRVAGLEEALAAHAAANAAFRRNWDLLQSWSEQSRYRRHRPEAASALLAAVNDRRNGVMRWVKQRW